MRRELSFSEALAKPNGSKFPEATRYGDRIIQEAEGEKVWETPNNRS